jgi:hypothetical protein
MSRAKSAAFLLLSSLLVACGASGPDDVRPASAGGSSGVAPPPSSGGGSTSPGTFDDQVAAGKALYAQRCSRCHGTAGEGRSGARLVGLDEGALASFGTARDVADFVLANMPPGAGGSLSQADGYSIVGFLVRENGLDSETALDPAAAQRIRLR